MKTGRLALTATAVLLLAGLAMVGCSEQAQRVVSPTADTQNDQLGDPFNGFTADFDIGDYVDNQYDFDAESGLEAEEDLNYDKEQQDSDGGDSDNWKNNDPA